MTMTNVKKKLQMMIVMRGVVLAFSWNDIGNRRLDENTPHSWLMSACIYEV
ncbi:hypothetical protein BofuT4_uP140320.1 [Botrytis cinerea T4]|uniref:Uncharacterized protein n=1 Tax=Botryotinia fuckeliana (strain T4) TaxID=999810 RepID=G2YYS2_BOTF4|nr:hypothetical protein BofuT4_uP140320.1 [Botrytis cinerea T4]